jgi:uncharacterized membrane protein
MVNLVINKNVEVKLSLKWVKKSFITFKKYPLQFILLTIVAIVICLLPYIGKFLGVFIAPLFVAQFVMLTEKVENQQPSLLSEVFCGIFSRKKIVCLAFINFCLTGILDYLDKLLVQPYMHNIDKPWALLIILSSFMLILHLSMWLAPIICLTNKNISPLDAMLWGLKAICYNVPVLLVNAVLSIALLLLALVPLGLGLLIVLPMFPIATYYVYHSLFSQK